MAKTLPVALPPDPPRKVGRPKGSPKTGGRKRGVAMWSSEQVRALALPPALDLLMSVAKGDACLVDDGMRGTVDKQSGALALNGKRQVLFPGTRHSN